MTAKQWRDENPNKKGNLRDDSSLEQLLVLANIESMNAELIHLGIEQATRLTKLNKMAIRQLKSLLEHDAIKRLKQ